MRLQRERRAREHRSGVWGGGNEREKMTTERGGGIMSILLDKTQLIKFTFSHERVYIHITSS